MYEGKYQLPKLLLLFTDDRKDTETTMPTNGFIEIGHIMVQMSTIHQSLLHRGIL